MKKKIGWVLLISGLVTTGCKYNSEEALYACSSADVRYSTTVANILTEFSCRNCHNNFTTPRGVNLDSYAGVKAEVINGRLYGAINHDPGFSPMPQGSPKLSDCNIKKIKAWIDAGAPNN